MFFISFFKGPGRFPNVFIITLSPAIFVPIYNIALFFISSLSFGNINKLFNVFPPSSMPGLHTCYRWTCSSHIVLWYRVPLCDIFSVLFWCFFLCPSCSSSVLVLLISSVWPIWDICIVSGPPLHVSILLLTDWGWSTLLWPYV